MVTTREGVPDTRDKIKYTKSIRHQENYKHETKYQVRRYTKHTNLVLRVGNVFIFFALLMRDSNFIARSGVVRLEM